MTVLPWTELVGYAASLLILASLVMRSVLRLRVINAVGAAVFTAYGLLIRAYPVAVVNLLILLVDLYYLYEFLTAREQFTLLEVRPDSEYLAHFLDHHAADIRRFLPGFRFQPEDHLLAFLTLRNAIPAGAFIARQDGPDCLWVVLDYVTPGYRDFKTARYVFREQAAFFRWRGIRRVCSAPGAPAHEGYLRRMGFVPDGNEYCLRIGQE